jgi:uncharacterized protein (DUF362 family)/NAD-dependent dihydropyrimidine dehydrogenase PreA subunit
MPRSIVAIEKCNSYQPETVDKAVGALFDELGGIERFVKPGARVFVKPNLLLAAPPDDACTTHPQILIATIEKLQRIGAQVSFGDLPGGFHIGGTRKIHEKSQMTRVAEATGARLVVLEQFGFKTISVPGAKFMKEIHVPKFLDDIDAIVNVGKLKTHMQTVITGAVKNTFGFVTSQDRILAHSHSRRPDFAEAIVDIFSALTPALNVVDAVVGMEGTGPSQGKPVRLGFLIGSADAVAADAVGAHAMGYKPGEIHTTEAAGRRGLGASRLQDIEIRGATLNSIVKKVKRPSTAVFVMAPILTDSFNELTKIKPYIAAGRCVECKMCAEVCPADAVRFSGKTGRIDDRRCILCYCCHEVCPHGAVKLNKPILVRLAELLRA